MGFVSDTQHKGRLKLNSHHAVIQDLIELLINQVQGTQTSKTHVQTLSDLLLQGVALRDFLLDFMPKMTYFRLGQGFPTKLNCDCDVTAISQAIS